MNMYDVTRPAEFNTPVEVRAPEDSAPMDFPDPNDPNQASVPPLIEPDDRVDESILVSVVDMPGKGIVEYSAQRYTIPPGQVVQIAGARRNRDRVQFYSETLDTDLRFARHPETLSVSDHAPVVPFEFPMVMNHNSAVWVTNVHVTEDRHICVIDEFIIED